MIRKLFFFTCFILSVYPGMAQEKRQPVSSSIEKVTVYIKGGQVTRHAKTTVPQGKTELVFSNISPDIDKQSIQVKGDGKFTILSVAHQLNHLQEQVKRDEISRLEIAKNELQDKLSIEQSMHSVYKQEEAMLLKNQDISGKNTGLRAVDLKEAIDFQRARLTEVYLKQAEIEKRIKKLDSTILKNNAQLQSLQQKKDLSTSDIIVTVSARESTPASFEIKYYVQNTGWFANYDLRVKDVSSPVELAFKANVHQNTGEDWKNVKLSLSNGNPSESGVAPQLQTWNLRFGYPPMQSIQAALQGMVAGVNTIGGSVSGKVTSATDGMALPGVNVTVKGTTIGTVSDGNGNYSLQIPSNATTLVFSFIGMLTQELPIQSSVINVQLQDDTKQLEEVVVAGYGGTRKNVNIKVRGMASTIPLQTQETYQATSMSFDIDMPYTVLSDGKSRSVDINSHEVPAIYEYYAVPKLDKDAFLTAKITDWQELNLMEGEVNLFYEGAFVGKSILDLRHASDTLPISLGRDKGIVIERKKLKEYSTKQFLSSNKTETRAYEITIRNNKRHPVMLILQDQFPISTTREITVDKLVYKEAELNEENKKLTWRLDMASRQEKKVGFKYEVKYPQYQVLILD